MRMSMVLPYIDVWSHGVAGGYGAVVAISVLISLFLVAIGYMLGSALRYQRLLVWSRSELWQAIASILIAALLIGTISALDDIMRGIIDESFTGTIYEGRICARTDSACHIQAAKFYLNNNIVNPISGEEGDGVIDRCRSLSINILRWNLIFSLVEGLTFSFEFAFKAFGVSVTPLAGLSVIVETHKMIFDLLVKLITVFTFQFILLDIIEMYIFPIFISVGIILRTFFFTRRLGGLMIAIAIGIYFVYPLMYVIGAWLWSSYLVATPHGTDIAVVNLNDAYNLMSELGFDKRDAEGKPTYEIIDETGADEASRKSTLIKLYKQTTNINWNHLDLDWIINDEGYLESVSRLLLYATFLPFITLMTTVAFVRTLSPLLGGDVEIAGLTRLI